MGRVRKFLSILLQILGVFFILCAMVISYQIVAMPWTTETIKNANQISGYLIRAGISKEQTVKVIFGEADYHPWMDDYGMEWCAQIESFDVISYMDGLWQPRDSDHAAINQLQKTGLIDVAARCFEEPIHDNKNLRFFILGIRPSSISDDLQFKAFDGVEAMVYDPNTRRIAFYGYQI